MKETVLIAAGGTGGHIYPALAMAEAFRSMKPDVTVEFVGTPSGLENKLVPAQGFKVHHLPIGRLNNVSFFERIFTLIRMPMALAKSFLLLRKIKPSFVLGVGGYASGPLLLVAALSGYRTAIWEPNAMPGLTNRWLARFVDECWVVFEDAKSFLKNRQAFTAGMPVRKEIEAVPQKAAHTPPFRILVFGGSQGARSVNTALAEMLKAADSSWLSGVRVVHQTGAADFARVKELYGSQLASLPVELKEYLHDMAEQYAKADLVVCRSGTGTLSELAACGLPAILIPFPFAADDHQRKNAENLVDKQAAAMILHQELSPEKLRSVIDELRADPSKLKRMGDRVRSFHQPQAAQNLVREFLQRMSHAPG
jgi:UDP-N-acetylglucosamine--N-acetylmuramyl-(pentapeptide) pyrophosphoryl-undecaprenol N-acetylglucosamine transferase